VRRALLFFAGARKAAGDMASAVGDLLGFIHVLILDRVAQHIPAAPNSFNVILTASRRRQLFAQLADEDVDDLEFRLVHAAVKVVQEHFLGERRSFAQRQQLEYAVFLAGQVQRLILDFHCSRVEIHRQFPGADD